MHETTNDYSGKADSGQITSRTTTERFEFDSEGRVTSYEKTVDEYLETVNTEVKPKRTAPYAEGGVLPDSGKSWIPPTGMTRSDGTQTLINYTDGKVHGMMVDLNSVEGKALYDAALKWLESANKRAED